MMSRIRLFFLVLLLGGRYMAGAQDLAGIWQGTLTQETGGCYPSYHLEIQLSGSGNTLQGYAYDYYDQSRYIRHHFTGRYNEMTKRMVLIEDRLMEVNIPNECVTCTKTYDLTLSKQDGKDVLTGDWKGYETLSKKACPPGKIALYRSTTTAFPIDVAQPEELAKLQKDLKIEPRENVLFSTLLLETPTVKIDLYDNAEIDNDTVTIFLNNKLLLYKQRLTENPLTLLLNALPNMDYELVMYADNLGSIPPNTALMVVTSGRQRQEVRLSASEQKNASVKFRVRPNSP